LQVFVVVGVVLGGATLTRRADPGNCFVDNFVNHT